MDALIKKIKQLNVYPYSEIRFIATNVKKTNISSENEVKLTLNSDTLTNLLSFFSDPDKLLCSNCTQTSNAELY